MLYGLNWGYIGVYRGMEKKMETIRTPTPLRMNAPKIAPSHIRKMTHHLGVSGFSLLRGLCSKVSTDWHLLTLV